MKDNSLLIADLAQLVVSAVIAIFAILAISVPEKGIAFAYR